MYATTSRVYAYELRLPLLASARSLSLAHALTQKTSGASATWHRRYVRSIHVL
jgi:hypothetical protein